ncbi:dipeptide epimerase [Spelaeicoccus albus]|uniref:Dipeptide epimerase n=1 Tax=Spelaeicoccus albus TaxID=1280376 RepID=A0A7Z0AD50_9MICO|nr:dipeptide epimerase [Spelaeicoccus albus]NYI67236.1 L-alanine-DL-glutamate epimerase-like enolase superfamily enzyme [Spelaeicoccus albus]
MPVARIRTHVEAAALTRPFITSRRRVDTVATVVVEVELADGTVGIGAASENPAVTGETVDSITALVTGQIADAVTGSPASLADLARAVGASAVGNASAKAAVDMAIHDAHARALGVPLTTLLGGDVRAAMAGDMTVSLDEPDVMARHAADAAESGFTCIKVKLGNDTARDLDRLRAVCDAAPHARLRLDANQGWNAKDAVRVIRRIEDADLPVDLVEQPVPKWDLDGLAAVTRAAGLPIMADESLASPHDAFELARRGAADLFNIKLAKCGGIRQALQIADIAEAAGIECMVGAMMEPRIAITAAAHVAAAHPNITVIDLDSADWFADSGTGGSVTVDGVLHLCGGPGLGIDPARNADNGHQTPRPHSRTERKEQ